MKKNIYDTWWFWVGVLVIILLFASIFYKTGTGNNIKVTNDSMIELEEKPVSFNQDAYNVDIISYKIISSGEKGNSKGENPVIAFWYDTSVSEGTPQNETINPIQAWADNYTVTQGKSTENSEELQLVSTPVDHFVESQVKQIQPGHTYQNAVAFELVDQSNSVYVTYVKAGSTEKISQEFRIK